MKWEWSAAVVRTFVMAERMRKLVEDTRVPHDGHTLQVTLSIGVASFVPARHDSPDALFEEADKYLYEAKHQGRNRVCAENLG